MKKLFTIVLPLTLVILGAILLSNLPEVSAQILTGTGDPGGLQSMTDATRKAANLGTVPIGQIVATVIRGALSFLGIVFIILMTVAGWRWMIAQGDAEVVTKAKDSIRTALIGLIIVLAAYAITYFVFKYLPFGGTVNPPGQATTQN